MSFLSHKRKKAQPKRPSGHAAEEALRPGTTASVCTKRMPWRPASPLRAEAAACHRFLLAAAFPSPSDEPSGLLFFLHVRAFHFSRRRCPRAADRLSHQGRLRRGGSRCSQGLRPQARTLPEPDTHTPHRPAPQTQTSSPRGHPAWLCLLVSLSPPPPSNHLSQIHLRLLSEPGSSRSSVRLNRLLAGLHLLHQQVGGAA